MSEILAKAPEARKATFIAELNQGDDWRIFGTAILIVSQDGTLRRILPDEFFLQKAEDYLFVFNY